MIAVTAALNEKQTPAALPKVLSARNLSKRFGHIQALENADIELEAGEIRAVCGENGAGKSTLVKILTGIIQSDTGTIEIDGRAVHIKSPRDSQQVGLNLVSQELSICPDLSVLDNIWLGSIEVPLLHRKKTFRDRARKTLEMLGAAHIDLDQPASKLNTGERQIVEIARMLGRNTQILILDEPTATLSDSEIERVMQALKALKREGHAILYITHRLSEVFEICDTVTVMRNGREVLAANVSDLDRKALIEAMLGRPFDEMFPTHKPASDEAAALRIADLNIPGTVEKLNLDVPRGQIVCLTGQIGSGAEDVVHAVAGMLVEAEGEISVNGRRLQPGFPEKAKKLGVRFVSGDRAEEGIFVGLSVTDNLVATRLDARGLAGVLSPGALRKEAARLAEKIRFDQRRLASIASTLSGGNQQKLAFGRCIDHGEPGVIVMIEPTRGIDVGARAEIYQLMRDFCDQGYGLLIASTDFSEVLGIGDRIVTLYRGKVVQTYHAGQVTMPQIVADVTHPVMS